MNKPFQKMICLLSLALAIPAFAQNSNAVIKGTVKDISSGALPGAEVNLVNAGTGEHRTEHSNKEGYFDFTGLNPGEYEVNVSAAGFGAWSGKLTLRVAQEATLAPIMHVAGTETTVDVIDVTPVIDRSDAILSDVKEAARIETLPLQDRNFLNILNFTPGVVANNFAGQGNGYTRVNGIPGGSMDYLVDGQSAAERFTNELQRTPQPLPTIQELKITTSNGSAEYARPGVVEVVTKSGTNNLHGQLFELNQISALRAKVLDQSSVNFLVHNEFGGNVGGPVYIPKLYNGKDKTFFFIDIEGIRERSAVQDRYTVPNANWKTGDFSDFVDASGKNKVIIYDPATTRLDPVSKSYVRDPFPGNKIPDARINDAARKIIAHVPNPNINVPYYQGQNYQVPNERGKSDSTLVTSKVDQIFGPNRLSARYTYTKQNIDRQGYFLNPNTGVRGGHNGAISFTEVIGPNIVNELRAGVQLFHAYSGPVLLALPITQSLGLPTYPGTVAWPSVYYQDSNGGYLFDGIDRDNPKDSPNTTISFGDNLSWTRGKHELKVGFSYNHVAVTTQETGQPGGDYSFSGLFTALMDPAAVAKTGALNSPLVDTGAGLADLLLGKTDYAGLNQYPLFHTRQTDYAGFLQDNWRVSQRLTLNLGLRYEYWTPFVDHDGRSANLDFSKGGVPIMVTPGSGAPSVSPAILAAYQAGGLKFESAATAGFPNQLWDMDKKNISPRVGLAFQADPKTTFRGGYGIYYWAMPLVQYHQNTRKNAPFSYSVANLVDNADSTAAELTYPVGPSTYANQSLAARNLGEQFVNPSALSITEQSGWRIEPWDPHYHPQRTQQWNVTMEHELPKHLGGRISYVGNHSDHLVMFDPINALIPRQLAAPNAGEPQRRAFPNFVTSSIDNMDLMRWNGYGNSNLLQTELKQQVNADMIVQAFFVWQRTLTTAEGGDNQYGALEMQPAALHPGATDAQRLRSIYAHDSYIPQYTFSFNTHYVLPFGHGKAFLNHQNGFADRLVSGWNVSAFYYWRSGLYFSPYYSVRGSSFALAPNKTGVLPKSQRTRNHWFDAAYYDPLNTDGAGGSTLPYNGQAYIKRTNSFDTDFPNNISRNTLTGPGFNNLDTTISKITPITERVGFDLEAQIFNTYNHVNQGLPSINQTGNIQNQVGLPRLIQLQGKITF